MTTANLQIAGHRECPAGEQFVLMVRPVQNATATKALEHLSTPQQKNWCFLMRTQSQKFMRQTVCGLSVERFTGLTHHAERSPTCPKQAAYPNSQFFLSSTLDQPVSIPFLGIRRSLACHPPHPVSSVSAKHTNTSACAGRCLKRMPGHTSLSSPSAARAWRLTASIWTPSPRLTRNNTELTKSRRRATISPAASATIALEVPNYGA